MYANVANFLNGKAESALDANTAQYLGGFNSAYYTNATNISTGTLAEPRLPFRMNQNVRTTDDVTFSNGTFIGTVSIGGDLVLTGNLYSQNVQSLSVADPLIKLGSNNSADTLWSGFLTHYSGSGYTNNHTGLIRDPSTKEYILMSTYADENNVNNNIIVVSDASFTYANLAVNSIKLGNNTSYSTLNGNTYSGTANNATFAYGKQESQLSVANSVYSNVANYLNGFNSSYFTNASNITTGILPWEVLPPSSINSTSSVTVSNTWTFQDIIINGGIKVQSSFGNTNQVLASNGSGGLYWKQDIGTLYYLQTIANTNVGVIRLYNANNVNNDVVLVGNGTSSVFSNSSYVVIDTQDEFVGTVTSVDGGAGLLGGPITDSGSLYVGAGAGISVNQDDVAVNAKEGLIANSSGLWVNTSYFSILSSEASSNNAFYLNFKTWESPGSIGNTTPNDGKFIDLQANTLLVKTNAVVNGYISVGNTVINSVYFPASANNAYRAFGKNENELNVNSSVYTVEANNASYLQGYTWDAPAAIGETTANTGAFTTLTVSGTIRNTANGAASRPPVSLTGAWFTGGNSTTTKSQLLIEPTGTTSTAWSTAGTGLGINAPSGFAGNFLDMQLNGVKYFGVSVNRLDLRMAGGAFFGMNFPSGYLNMLDYDGNTIFSFQRRADAMGLNLIGTNLSWGVNYYTPDVTLSRDAANTLALRRGVNAQTFRVYNTFTDASNYERGKLEWSSNVFRIGTERAGTGVARALELQTNGTSRIFINTSGYVGVGNTAPGQSLQVDGSIGIKNGLVANGSFGDAGFVLASNGTSIYWSNASGSATTANNASYLQGYTWETPAAIGETTANTGKFTYANVTSHIAFAGAAHMMGLGKITVSGMSPANIFEFSVATYTGGKMIIEVTDTHTNFRHISELLLSHDNTNVVATEYGVVQTGNTSLATFETDILSGNVRILATPISSNTTTFKVIQNLFLA